LDHFIIIIILAAYFNFVLIISRNAIWKNANIKIQTDTFYQCNDVWVFIWRDCFCEAVDGKPGQGVEKSVDLKFCLEKEKKLL